MKKFLFLILILVSALGISQTPEQKRILNDAQSFMTYFEQRDYGKIIDMTHPKVLELFSKENLEAAFKTLLEGNEEMKISIKSIPEQDFQVSEIFESEDKKTRYAFVTFPMSMTMEFLKETPTQEMKDMLISMMAAQGMKGKFTSPSVIDLKTLSMTIGMNNAGTKNEWKYMNRDQSSPLYKAIMPEEIARHANNYYTDILKQKENAN